MSTADTTKSTINNTGQILEFTDCNMAARKRHSKSDRLKNKPAVKSPNKLRQWSNEPMIKALEVVASDKIGINRAALEFNVPCTTLKDRVAGRVGPGVRMGPKPYQTYKEEHELVEFLINCSKMGYSKT